MNYKPAQDPSEINLIYLILRIIDKLHYIVLAVLIGALAVAATGSETTATTVYTAMSRIYLIDTEDSVNSTLNISVANSMVGNYVTGFSNSELHQMVAAKVDLPYAPDQLASMVRASNMIQTHILDITATSAVSAEEAKLLANTYAETACEFFAEKFNMGKPSVFEEADLPAPTILTSQSANPVIGAIVGMALSFIIILLQAIFDNRLRIPDDIARCTTAPFLGAMTVQKNSSAKQVAVRKEKLR